MFLKNWDMSKIYQINGDTVGETRLNRDKEIILRYYDGSFSTNYIGSHDFSFWSNGYYQKSPVDYDDSKRVSYSLWPGGDIENAPARIIPGIEPKKISYEDYNLYSPFNGGNAPGTGTIYGQSHILSSVVYNEEKDTWERTVTREFKNISGKEITIKELGVFQCTGVFVAREILEEPIVVQDDSYFKLSFTWTIENPHENKKEERIRLYSLPFYSKKDASETTPHYIVPVLKKRMILVRIGSIFNLSSPETIESHKENFQLTLEGWNAKNLTSFFTDERTSSNYNNELNFVSIELLTPDENEKDLNKITQPHNYNGYNYYYTFFGWIYLEDDVIDVSYKEKSLIRQLVNPIVVNKEKDEKNILWIGVDNIQHKSPWHNQLDENYCDFYYVSSHQNACFFFDQTDATEHSFLIGNDSLYEAIAMVRLDLTLKEGEVLYKDVPVK
jgi:hypothetical protein